MKAIYTLHITVFNLLLGIQREFQLYFYFLCSYNLLLSHNYCSVYSIHLGWLHQIV